MKLLKYFLKVIVFCFTLFLFSYAIFIFMIQVAIFFKQYYFLIDINKLINSSKNQVNFSLGTWILLIYGLIFTVIIAILYAKNSINSFIYLPTNKDGNNLKNVLLALVVIWVVLGSIAKTQNIIWLNSFIIFLGIITTVNTVIPINKLLDLISNKSILIVDLLTPTVYRRFLHNYFDFKLNDSVRFWAQNVGKRKDKFRFKGLCRLTDFENIKMKKQGANSLLCITGKNKWELLNTQDTMPVESISKTTLKHFLGLFNEEICIIYENVGGKLYKENLNISNYNNAIILYPHISKLNYLYLIDILSSYVETYFVYLWAKYYNSFFLYTLAFTLFLIITVIFVFQSIINLKNIRVKVACERNNNKLRVQIRNESKNKLDLNLKIFNKGEKNPLLIKNNIPVDSRCNSYIMTFLNNSFKLNSDKKKDRKKLCIVLECKNKKYIYIVR